MAYIDVYAAAVPYVNKDAYFELAAKLANVYKRAGALKVTECWEDDVPEGKLTSFPLAVKREAGEALAFGWIEWPSKAVRDEGWKKAMADPDMGGPSKLFDGNRLIFGGFESIFGADVSK